MNYQANDPRSRHTFLLLAFKLICDNLDRDETHILTTVEYDSEEENVWVFFIENLYEERSSTLYLT